MGANMVATSLRAPSLYLCIIVFLGFIGDFNFLKVKLDEEEIQGGVLVIPLLLNTHISSAYMLNQRLRRHIVSWNRHGFTLLAVPECSILLDITIFMDVHPQPGPIEVLKRTCSGHVNLVSNNEARKSHIRIDRRKLLSFRNFTGKPSASIMTYLKSERILKYRGRRGGIEQDRQTINKIAVVNGR